MNPHALQLLEQANALTVQRRFQEAIPLFQQVITAEPGDPNGYHQLGGMLYVAGYAPQARGVLDIGIGVIPGSPLLHWARCMATLPMVYRDAAEMDAVRAEFTSRLRTLREVCFASPSALTQAATAAGSLSPFFMAYQGRDDTALYRLHGELVSDIMAAALPRYTAPVRRSAIPGEPIRVGIVCGHFWRHAIWRMPVRGWVDHLDRSRFRLFGYHTRPERDDQTVYASRIFDRFVQGTPANELMDVITADAPHVLIYPELATDRACIQLASLRLAPVQCTSWGHPVTTGIRTIDHYLSSDLMEPPGGQGHYTENLVRLPGLGVVCRPDYAAWGQALPEGDLWPAMGVEPGTIRITCCQSLPKYLPDFDDILPRIALGLPTARFLFVSSDPHGAAVMTARLHDAFGRHGLDAGTFCRMSGTLSGPGFSAMIRDAHIFLDTPVWSGCNTTLDALGHGIPVVTLPGPQMRGRHSLAILTKAGVTQTIAASVDDYIAIAVRLGLDTAWRTAVSAAMVQGCERVFSDHSPVRGLEDFLTEAVSAAAG